LIFLNSKHKIPRNWLDFSIELLVLGIHVCLSFEEKELEVLMLLPIDDERRTYQIYILRDSNLNNDYNKYLKLLSIP
jgi:hypothetical protein